VAWESGEFGQVAAPFSRQDISKIVKRHLQRHRRQAHRNLDDFAASASDFLIGVQKISAANALL